VLPLTRCWRNGRWSIFRRDVAVGRNGATCLVEGCCAPVHDAESEVVGAVLVIRDITVRQRFEQEWNAPRGSNQSAFWPGASRTIQQHPDRGHGNITLALLDAGGLATVERYLQEAERATLRARILPSNF